MTNSQRRKYGRQVARINRQLESKWLRPVQRAIEAKIKAVIARLRQDGVPGAMRYIMEDMGNPALTAVVRRLYVQVGSLHARRVNTGLQAELRKSAGFDIEQKRTGALGINEKWVQFVLDYLEKNLITKLTWRMDETTRKGMIAAIQKAYGEGKGVDDIIALLQGWPRPRYWAARIVRTEINRAANVGTMAAGSTFPYEQQKEWIAAHDDRTRGNPINGSKDHANHWGLDGMVTEEQGFFTDPRNGDLMSFPGDPSASAASVINCRCTSALTAKRGADGRLIRKEKRQSRITVIMPTMNNNNFITI